MPHKLIEPADLGCPFSEMSSKCSRLYRTALRSTSISPCSFRVRAMSLSIPFWASGSATAGQKGGSSGSSKQPTIADVARGFKLKGKLNLENLLAALTKLS